MCWLGGTKGEWPVQVMTGMLELGADGEEVRENGQFR